MPLPLLPIAIGAAGLLGFGASKYSADKAADSAKDAQRDLGSELDTIATQLPGLSSAGLNNQQQNAGAYNELGNQNLQQGLFGNPTFDAVAALASKSPAEQASIAAEAERTGRSPEEWLTAHTLEQMRNGNAPAQADFERFGSQTGGLSDTLGQLQSGQDQLNADSSTFQRTRNLQDMQALAPQAAGLYRDLNPELFAGLDRLDSSAQALGQIGTTEQAYLDSLGGPTAIEQALEKQALDELALGDQLSDDEARQVRVQSRHAADARGRGFSNAALADEVLNTANARQARLDSRRGFATGTDQLLRSGQSADRAALAQAAAFEQQRNTTSLDRQLAATGLRGSTAYDPASVLGAVDNRLNSTTTLGMTQQQFQGAPDYLSLLLGYGGDLNSSNSNALAAGGIGQANAYSALGGGLLSAAGSLGGAYLSRDN